MQRGASGHPSNQRRAIVCRVPSGRSARAHSPSCRRRPWEGRLAIEHEIHLTVNGHAETCLVPAGLTLLELLRDRLYLRGTKEGCGIGECGACTVLLNGLPVASCLVLAVEADGCAVETVEGEVRDGRLSEIQEAFLAEGAVQCGFCTPGMIMSARGLLRANPNPSDEEIVEAMAGNLCRCTGYEAILAAVRAASRRTPDKRAEVGAPGERRGFPEQEVGGG